MRIDAEFDLGLGTIDLSNEGTADQVRRALYAPPAGLPALRDAIARHENVDAECVTVTTGASMALTSIFSTLNPGDGVVLPKPYYPAYPGLLANFGLEPQFAALTKGSRWSFDMNAISAAITSTTKAVIWNAPHNPTGAVSGSKELRALAKIAEDHDLLLIADEVYRDLWLQGLAPPAIEDFVPACRLVRVRSFSKLFQMAGERVGYAIAPSGLAQTIARSHWRMAMSAPISGQRIALAQLSGDTQALLISVNATLRENRDMAVELLQRAGLTVTAPEAGIFLWLDLGHEGVAKKTVAELADAGIVVMGGAVFGDDRDQYVRCSFGIAAHSIRHAYTTLADRVSRTAARNVNIERLMP